MKPYRIEKIASVIQTLVSEIIHDGLQDPRISVFTSVTQVSVSPDLEWAKVHISVMGSEGDQEETMAALAHAAGHITSMVARELHIRQCPRLRFVSDVSLKRAAEIMRVIDENAREMERDAARRASPDPNPIVHDGGEEE